MSKKEQFIDLVKSNNQRLKDLLVKELGLFCSVRTETDLPNSDIDLLVEFESGKKSFDRLFSLKEFFEIQLNCPVDLVTRKSLSPVIGPKILKEIDYVQISNFA